MAQEDPVGEVTLAMEEIAQLRQEISKVLCILLGLCDAPQCPDVWGRATLL